MSFIAWGKKHPWGQGKRNHLALKGGFIEVDLSREVHFLYCREDTLGLDLRGQFVTHVQGVGSLPTPQGVTYPCRQGQAASCNEGDARGNGPGTFPRRLL